MALGNTASAHAGESEEMKRAWSEATRLFCECTKDVKKRELVDSLFTSSHPQHFLEELLGKTQALHAQRLSERGRWQERIERAFQTIDKYACIGDVLVNNQGAPITSAWAAVRICLKCAIADLETCKALASILVDIPEQFASAGTRLLHFPADKSVFEAATQVYASILRILISAVRFLACNKGVRTFKALSRGTDKFKEMHYELQQRTASLDRVVDIAGEGRSRQKDQADSILHWLSPHQVSRLESYVPEHGTCDWLLTDPNYDQWQVSGCSGPLFIEGAPGTGKTVLADRVFRTAVTPIKIFHSCYESPSSIDFAISGLRYLLKTIANSPHPATWHKVVMAKTGCLVHEANQSARPRISQLQEIIRDIFSSDKFPSVTIVVDALSSCGEEDDQLMVECLERLAKLSNVKVVILTRVRPATGCKYLIRMDADTIGSEVLKYANARISRAPVLEKMSSEILKTVSEKSLGMFLYAKLLLDDLERAATHFDREEILTRAPNGLWDYFRRLWLDRDRMLRPIDQAHRNTIFQVLVAAREPLHPDTVAHFIALDTRTNKVSADKKYDRPRVTLEYLCGPFIALMEDCVEIAHPSMKHYLQEHISSKDDPNAYLAEKCLSQLSNERYARPSYAASYLRRHLIDRGLNSQRFASMTDEEAIPYDYAVRHWQEHMFAVSNPSKALLSRLATFVTQIEVVSWSERLADLRGKNAAAFLNAVIEIGAALRVYIRRLPVEESKDFPLEGFFAKGHENLQQNLNDDDEGNHLIPYLPFLRLGQWHSMGGKSTEDFRKAYKYKELVVKGFTRVLGKRSPLTLVARTSWVNEFWFLEQIVEAVTELIDIVQDYRYIIVENPEPYLRAVQNLGVGYYFLTDFTRSLESLQESEDGLLEIKLEKQWVYQVNDLYKGWVLERQGILDGAQGKLESILKSWAPIAGESNGLSLMAKTALGSVYRKQGEYEKAMVQLLFAWRERLKLFTINSNTTVDSGLHLAITLREMGQLQESEDILDQIEKSDIFDADIGRQNQMAHIRALIEFDRGNFNSPKNELTRVVQETTGSDRNRNNRAALWIRTTVADALRHEGKESEALALFSELVKPRQDPREGPPSPTLMDEPEPASRLALAEKALRYVQNRDQAAAVKLLEEEGLQWVRDKDFWIQQGGPPADTAWMKPPKFDDFVKIHMP